jgi:pyruvate dehydrogenase E2 component (dihydrolipoamide acetyltransferase)
MDGTMSDQSRKVVIPQLGLTMTEATILEWHKLDGSWVEKGENLFTLENEKSTLDIESPASGFLHIMRNVGETVPVLGQIGELRQEAAPGFSEKQEPAPERTLTVPGKVFINAGRIAASPKARRTARSKGIDLTAFTGSGPRGMITTVDLPELPPGSRVKASPVARRIAAETGVNLAKVGGTGPRGQVTRRDVEQALNDNLTLERTTPGKGKALPLVGLRGIIANRLSASWQERPQVTLTTEADATYLVAAREQMNLELASTGRKVSYNAILVHLVARALVEHSYMNVQLSETGIQVMPFIHIGVAVDTDKGLVVPVVRHANQKTVIEINETLQTLSERALLGRCLPDDLSGSTFTLTNLGMYEIDAFTPIINPPECAILGTGRILEKPVGLKGQITLRPMMALSLAFDHRLVDGAPAARFLQRIKNQIERYIAFSLLG